MAILKHALDAYNNPNPTAWKPWLEYQALTVNATDLEIEQWLERQAGPEKYCNMCFNQEPAKVIHTLKVKEHD